MCGIVQNPTKIQNFLPANFQNLPPEIVVGIAKIGEENHMPDSAIRLVLIMANKFAGSDFVIERVAISTYVDGKRYVSPESLALEQEMFHLAMGTTVLDDINSILANANMKFTFMHCCGGEIQNLYQADFATKLSREGNLWRAEELRRNPKEITVSHDKLTQLTSKSYEKSHPELIKSALGGLIIHDAVTGETV